MRGFDPHYPPHFNVGVSPSGKAMDSDSIMRRFESFYPSQSYNQDSLLGYKWRHSQVVRQRSAKPLFPSSNLGVASRAVEVVQRLFSYDKDVALSSPRLFNPLPLYITLYRGYEICTQSFCRSAICGTERHTHGLFFDYL